MDGMSPAASTRCFGPGLGRAHEFEIALGEVASSFIDRIIRRDPVAIRQMKALAKGEPFAYDFDTLLEREKHWLGAICTDAGVAYPGDDLVKAALEKMSEVKGMVTEHDRVVIGKLGLPQIFQAFYALNDRLRTSGEEPVWLYTDPGKEFWRTDKAVEHLPTEFGVLRQDFGRVAEVDRRHQPRNLTYDQHHSWTLERGGDGMTSAEETSYLELRCQLEFNRPLFSGISIRCRNAYGSDYSLYVYSSAVLGFYVDRMARHDAHWYCGALAREFVGLGV